MTTPTPMTDAVVAAIRKWEADPRLYAHTKPPKSIRDHAVDLEIALASQIEITNNERAQKERLTSELAAAQEALKNHLHLDNHNAIVRQLEERAQRAEALAESYRDALNRFKEEREGNTRQFRRLQERLAQAEADAFSMSAGQCIVTNGGLMGDDHGHLYCDMQRQRDELRGRVRVMADIMNTALDVIKTVEGDGSDEDEALMHIRAKMASAIDSVRRDDKSAIDAAREGK